MKLQVCFFWHMHQPYYKDPESGRYILPWVRLHAIKDYVALPRLFRQVKGVKHTFNLVPSLLAQVEDYVENGADDLFLSVSRKNAFDLTREERLFALHNFFSAFPPTMILPQPRYAELFHRKDEAIQSLETEGSHGEFGASDFNDLATLFNLTWFHPLLREEDSELTRLWEKGRGYTEKEKNFVLDRQLDVMATLIPEYRKLVHEDGGELSCSPMYHPILPLLIDNKAAQDALPGVPLPKIPFAYPEDAIAQLSRGRDAFKSHFGVEPRGVWPSEGSISPAALDAIARTGFRWAATDEILLCKALGKGIQRDSHGVPNEPDWFYRPYAVHTPHGNVDMLFRDHHLSDLIGFEYSRWDNQDAVNHFVSLVGKIYDKLKGIHSGMRRENYILPVILDGENAWEYFYDSGRFFLLNLFKKMEALGPDISCVTISEALSRYGEAEEIPKVPVGSWIDGTFGIWIGHQEDHAAWEALARVRNLWKSRSEFLRDRGDEGAEADLKQALEHIYIAEGSDWCWWYGDDHFTPHGPEFDQLFRHHVKEAYRLLKETPPDSLDIPIIQKGKIPVAGKNVLKAPRDYIHPKINGMVSSYFEWSAATRYLPTAEFGAMHRAGFGILSALYYGFNEKNAFLRIDFNKNLFDCPVPVEIEIILPGKKKKVEVLLSPDGKLVRCDFVDVGEKTPDDGARSNQIVDAKGQQVVVQAAYEKVLEVALPFALIGCEDETRLEFILSIRPEGTIGERWPMFGAFTGELPGGDYAARMWEV